MERFDFWHKWMLAISVVVIVFGLMLAFLYDTVLFKAMDEQISRAFWDNHDDITPAMHDYQRWVLGLSGAVMAGWGVQLFFTLRYPFKHREAWAWNGTAAALLTWFVVDETFSLYYGVYFNALFNLGLLLAIGLPLIFTRKFFIIQRESI
jgi:hypothetical protein